VVGTTGSGKTNTCLTLLSQLAEQRVPFLVIEPVNAGLNEYRALKHLPACATDAFRLQVFTLGDEDTAPFALNPLEIVPGDTMDAHISRLMTCLRAALPMWPPLPAIFAAALQRTYLKAGFLPRTRVAPGEPFPSMYDFADELGYVANHEVQHGGEVRQNIIGATTLRLQALMNGAAGRTLGARRSIPLDDLLARPTILELRHIGDDGDKALIMALILMRIAAAQELAGRRPEPGRPRHVILIEEAHRLLSAQPAGASDQQETTRGEVAQSFAHMLAETRKYGQSVIIAEQLPQKLVRDALGNTGLKIAHLLGSREDREALAATMRLDTPQQEALASLPPGEALVYSQGQEAPVRVSIDFVSARWPELRIDPDTIPDDREISAWMEPVNRRLLPYRLPFWGCAGCQSQCINRGAGEAMVRLSEAVQAVDQLTNSGGAGGDRALPRLVEAVDIHLSTIGIVRPARDLRYCAAIHLLYKTCGSLVDSSGVWERLSTYLTQAALIGRQERGA
jgi:hypothetical protein